MQQNAWELVEPYAIVSFCNVLYQSLIYGWDWQESQAEKLYSKTVEKVLRELCDDSDLLVRLRKNTERGSYFDERRLIQHNLSDHQVLKDLLCRFLGFDKVRRRFLKDEIQCNSEFVGVQTKLASVVLSGRVPDRETHSKQRRIIAEIILRRMEISAPGFGVQCSVPKKA